MGLFKKLLVIDLWAPPPFYLGDQKSLMWDDPYSGSYHSMFQYVVNNTTGASLRSSIIVHEKCMKYRFNVKLKRKPSSSLTIIDSFYQQVNNSRFFSGF